MPAVIVPAVISLVGMAMSSKGQADAANAAATRGERAQNEANYEASQLEVNAGQAKAAAQRQAENIGRQTDVMQSRGLALAAASGGSASDPSIVNLLARNAGIGAYQQAVALYGGDTAARDMNMRAQGTRYSGELSAYDGQTAANAGRMRAGASLLDGASSLYSKYAHPAPRTNYVSPYANDSITAPGSYYSGGSNGTSNDQTVDFNGGT
jgi:hypothetical protein